MILEGACSAQKTPEHTLDYERFRLFALSGAGAAGAHASQLQSNPYCALSHACRCLLPWSHEELSSASELPR